MNKIKNRPINQTIEEYINLVHVKSDKHCRIVNEPKFGYIVEADASVYEFFGGIKTYLHLFVDRYTGKILAGHLDHQETLAGYQQAFYQLVKKYGIPMKLVTDKRTIFVYKRVSSNSETAKLTQFGYWAEKLGMDLYTTSTSQEKPMVERANRTLQDRITALFSLYKNMTIEKANELLPSLIKETNCSLNYSEKGLENVFEKYNEDRFGPLEIMLSIRETRMMANGFIFSLNGMKCEAHDPNTGKLMHYLPKTPILSLTTAKREKILSICNGFYDIVEYKKDGRRAISHIGFPIKRDHPWMQCKDFIRYKVDYPVRTNSIYESPIKTNCYNS